MIQKDGRPNGFGFNRYDRSDLCNRSTACIVQPPLYISDTVDDHGTSIHLLSTDKITVNQYIFIKHTQVVMATCISYFKLVDLFHLREENVPMGWTAGRRWFVQLVWLEGKGEGRRESFKNWCMKWKKSGRKMHVENRSIAFLLKN